MWAICTHTTDDFPPVVASTINASRSLSYVQFISKLNALRNITEVNQELNVSIIVFYMSTRILISFGKPVIANFTYTSRILIERYYLEFCFYERPLENIERS